MIFEVLVKYSFGPIKGSKNEVQGLILEYIKTSSDDPLFICGIIHSVDIITKKKENTVFT